MTLMYVAHHAFRRDLDLLARAVPATPVGARATWRALHERYAVFAKALHLHHSGEDAGLWPLLLERVDAVGDRAARETLEAMESEHAAFDPLLTGCDAGLRLMAAGGDAADRAALAAVVVAARDALGRHLLHEETETIALIQRHLTQADWERVDEEHFKPHLPGLRELAVVVPWFCQGLPEDVRARGFADAGKGFTVLYLLTRGRFARHHRRAFAYLDAAVSAPAARAAG
jgi:hemerythrin-like domain-containing protein